MERRIDNFLMKREESGLLRDITPVTIEAGSRVKLDTKEFVNFSSNDYLGLAGHPEILEAARSAAGPVFGSSSSRLMSGSTRLHALLEDKTAVFKGKPSSLIFNTGYQANVGAISAMCARGDAVFSDKLNHASIVDGIRLSGAKCFRFRHNDMGHLEDLLSKERGNYRGAMIITESVFSMDGDIAFIGEIVRLKKQYDSFLMVDEAHATGVFGPRGEGVVGEKKAAGDCDIIMGTFSKALGGFGAYVAVTENVKKYLINTSRGFIYSTALPASVVNADIKAIDIVIREPHRREALLSNAAYFRQKLREKSFTVKGESQIIPVIIGDNNETVRLSEKLKSEGYWVTPVRPPTVPEGTARLRVSLTCNHTREMIDNFIKVF